MENKNLQQTQPSYWNESERKEIAKTLAVVINGQKSYGQKADISDTFDYYRMKLDGRYPANVVLGALQVYTDKREDVPAPADLIAIMDPPKPRITESEFIEAQKWQERNGYPIFSWAKSLIEEYREQQEDERDNFKCNNEKLISIASMVVKRIG